MTSLLWLVVYLAVLAPLLTLVHELSSSQLVFARYASLRYNPC